MVIYRKAIIYKGERNMIVDKKGKLFEDRRKNKEDRRKVEIDTTGGRRKKQRRTENNKMRGK